MSISKFEKITQNEIRKLEELYNISLPQDYKRFLMDSNGGIVEKYEKNSIFIESLKDSIVIDVLYGIETGNENSDINHWMKMLSDNLLENALIIGDDVMQGLIIMICEGDNKGIYYWDDSYNYDSSDDEGNTYWIVESFTDFYKALC